MPKKRLKYLKKLPSNTCYTTMPSPVGTLTIFAENDGLNYILWQNESQSTEAQEIISYFSKQNNHPMLQNSITQLQEYFHKQRTTFSLPVKLYGTVFQMQTWQQLQQIPYGRTISYGEQAAKLGDKNKARAVGMANGLNPISIIIPCHRVIGSNGTLTGFAGGLTTKQTLLLLEQSHHA